MRPITATGKIEDVGRASTGCGGDDESIICISEDGIRNGERAKPPSTN